MSTWCRRDGDDLVLLLRVKPRARRTAWAGSRDGRGLLALQAPPVDGKANTELVKFLARQFGVPKRRIHIESGEKHRDKRVRIGGPVALPTDLDFD